MGNGELTPWGAETAEPIEMKLGMGAYVGDRTPRCTKRKVYIKRGRLGVEVKCSTQACFVSFSFFWFPEQTSSLAGKDWLGALCTQKRVLVVN